MFKIDITKKDKTAWQKQFATEQEALDYKAQVEKEGVEWGKPQRQVWKKGQSWGNGCVVDSEDYDESDVISEEEVLFREAHQTPIYEKDENGELVFVDEEWFNPITEQNEVRQVPKVIGYEDVPATYKTKVTLKAEYEVTGPIDLTKDPEYIEQFKIKKHCYNIQSGEETVIFIGAMIDGSDNEDAFFANYEEHFSKIEFLLKKGRLETVRELINLNKENFPIFTVEQVERVVAYLDMKIAGRPVLGE